MRILLPITAGILLASPFSTALGDDGESHYREARPSCGVCHDSGTAGAPKIGDPESWGERLNESIEKMTQTVLKGKGAMPAYQGRMSEEEARAAVIWMVEETKE